MLRGASCRAQNDDDCRDKEENDFHNWRGLILLCCCLLRGGCRTRKVSARLVFCATHPTGNTPHLFGTLRNALRSLCCHRISTPRAKAWESADSDNRTFENTRHPASRRKRGLMFRNGSENYVPDACDAKTSAEKVKPPGDDSPGGF